MQKRYSSLKNLPTYEQFILENESTIESLDKDKQEMVKGIAEILKQITDKPNRSSIAKDQIEKFKKEGINFKYADFLEMCGLKVEEFEGSLGPTTMPLSTMLLATQPGSPTIAF
jgi:hypothetical protein